MTTTEHELREIARSLDDGLVTRDLVLGEHNVVTALEEIAHALHHVARAIEGKVEDE